MSFLSFFTDSNKQILDGLLPKSTPASALESMTVRGICKAGFHQMFGSV
jgi:hypothetical protein